MKRLMIVALCCLLPSVALAEVTATKTDGRVKLNNGLIEAVIDANGDVVSFKDLRGGPVEMVQKGQKIYWDANAEAIGPTTTTPPKKGYYRPSPDQTTVALAATPAQADVTVTSGPTEHFGFRAERHYVMKDGLSGLYAYVVFRHAADMPAARLWQTRFVVRTSPDVFNVWSVSRDNLIRIPRAEVVSKLMDATFRLADGTVKTKYLNSVYWGEVPAYGTLAVSNDKSRGIWMLEPSPEYHNGGPIKQGQTVHDDVLLRVLQSAHFGAKSVDVQAGETWSKVYGPFLIYANQGASPQALWTDIDRQLSAEKAQWPYGFVTAPDYAKTRGSLTGKVRLNGAAAGGAKVILSDVNTPWPDSVKGYNYWGSISADGQFRIEGIAPGTYALSVTGADQPTDFIGKTVTIKAGEQDAGTLNWAREMHGKTLWQLGSFDRRAAEFRNGDASRGYQMFTLYPQQFPNDVDFTVGKSVAARDWNYAQWSWYMKEPSWHLRFTAPAQTGQATLTIGIASAQPAKGKLTDVRVAINGQEIGAIRLPKTGTAGYRGGMQDQNYNLVTLTFDAKLLKGDNDLTFRHADGQVFDPALVKAASDAAADDDQAPGTGAPGQVMYDAIRLEVK
ncbi:polysaccharide lyase family protein [Asticcacaulis sp. BYS171W]|uniref:rhamnogalacturonan endolyase n=1 Tax=Asticcacaulis aquaticus TaxID=2984212 RepID=A0ABT5HU93_9CAUL|nr:polysaccharide lyase family protein [Asticcacaulis aquaticus]MDC7683641.1 polysaccharide lyase family protein [Asticcacaulis aquaticus]